MSICSRAVHIASSIAPRVLPAYSRLCFARHALSTSRRALRQSLMIRSLRSWASVVAAASLRTVSMPASSASITSRCAGRRMPIMPAAILRAFHSSTSSCSPCSRGCTPLYAPHATRTSTSPCAFRTSTRDPSVAHTSVKCVSMCIGPAACTHLCPSRTLAWPLCFRRMAISASSMRTCTPSRVTRVRRPACSSHSNGCHRRHMRMSGSVAACAQQMSAYPSFGAPCCHIPGVPALSLSLSHRRCRSGRAAGVAVAAACLVSSEWSDSGVSSTRRQTRARVRAPWTDALFASGAVISSASRETHRWYVTFRGCIPPLDPLLLLLSRVPLVASCGPVASLAS